MNEVKFANTVIRINSEVVAKVTGFSRNVEISEEDVTGAEDYIPGTDVLRQQFVSIAVGENAEMEGISIESSSQGLDVGQSELRDAAENGQMVEVIQTRNTGHGYRLSGFFTSYEESASTSEVYKWSGSFRVNSKVPILPGS